MIRYLVDIPIFGTATVCVVAPSVEVALQIAEDNGVSSEDIEGYEVDWDNAVVREEKGES